MQVSTLPDDPARSSGASPRTRPSFLRSVWFELLGLLLFVAIFNLLPGIGGRLNDAGLVLLGMVLALVPAVLWLLFFYRMDRAEPEPKRLVIGVYLAGGLLAAALYIPLFGYLFAVDSWLPYDWWSELLGGTLVIGMVAMAIVYAAVRVVVFDNPEFDERLDGILYAVAAGLGVATVNNFAYVLQHGGVDLDVGSIRMVTNTLGYASAAAVLGYFLGQARFEKVPIFYLPLGVLFGALLTGLYFFILDRAGAASLTGDPWRDLLLGFFLALVTMAAVAWLVRRSDEETLRVSRVVGDGDRWEGLPAENSVAEGDR